MEEALPTVAAVNKQAPSTLRYYLIFLLIVNALSLAFTFLGSSFLVAVGFSSLGILLLLSAILPIITIVFVVRMFKMKKIAFFGICATYGAGVVLGFVVGVGIFSAIGIIWPVILYILVRSHWTELEKGF